MLLPYNIAVSSVKSLVFQATQHGTKGLTPRVKKCPLQDNIYTQVTSKCRFQSYRSAFNARRTGEGI
jgi:hypothetical protein